VGKVVRTPARMQRLLQMEASKSHLSGHPSNHKGEPPSKSSISRHLHGFPASLGGEGGAGG